MEMGNRGDARYGRRRSSPLESFYTFSRLSISILLTIWWLDRLHEQELLSPNVHNRIRTVDLDRCIFPQVFGLKILRRSSNFLRRLFITAMYNHYQILNDFVNVTGLLSETDYRPNPAICLPLAFSKQSSKTQSSRRY